MADVSGQTILNEAALKRLDPYVKKVLDTAKFVALYSFKLKESKWEKIGVEGPLFVYSRTGEPFYNILVLNRLNTNNLIEPISSKLTLQLHEPFLLYLNSKCRLYGMWFYEKDECPRLASLIETLTKEQSESKVTASSVKPSNGLNLDICKMLTRAQEAYNNSKMRNVENDGTKEQDVDETPQSVVEFFAKASGAPKKTGLPLPHSAIIPGRTHSTSEGENGESPINPLIHQLMSNPVHMVEHIEKQQRMVTPQPSEVPSNKVLKTLIGKAGELQEMVKESSKKCGKLENGVNNYSHRSPTCTTAFFPQSPAEGALYSFPSGSVIETPKKPALLPPAMFTPQSHKESPDEGYSNDIKVEPLTRNQLFQALNYLLRNDPLFMTKIHEAYVKSLTDKVL